MVFKVRATLGSFDRRRRVESRSFKSKGAAQKFADLTNKDRPGSNARVVLGKKKKKR